MAADTDIKVFLVEDEFVIREGIRSNIDWRGNQLEFAGEASDGELALPMIREKQPDIVITDIRMPFMDGLEMSAVIKREFPQIEILLLTGYEEFEYARKGLEIGAAKYLTKPISSEELLNEVKALAMKIRMSRAEQEIRQKYLKEMEEQRRKDRRDFFLMLAAGGHNVSEMMSGAEKLGIQLLASCYNMILLTAAPSGGENESFSEYMIGLDEKINALEDENCIVFDRGLEGKALFLKAQNDSEMQLLTAGMGEKLCEIFNGCRDITYFGGIGRIVHRLSELNLCFAEAGRALSHRYFMEQNCILDSSELESGAVDGNGAVREQEKRIRDTGVETIDPSQYDRERISEFLHTGSIEEADSFVNEFFRQMRGKSMESFLFRQYISMDMYFLAVGFIEKLGIDRGQLIPLEETAKAAEGADDLIACISELIRETLRLRDQTARNQYQEVVTDIIRYIENHYADDELSLNMLAAHVNFSPNHLSTIFSQETGRTFIKYLTDYRMKKAKALLRTSGKKSSEICFEVGYKDPHYFSYLFKKTQGMTPTEYRSGIK